MSKPKVWGKAFRKNLTKLLESQKDLMPDYLKKRWQITEGGRVVTLRRYTKWKIDIFNISRTFTSLKSRLIKIYVIT